MKANKTKHLIYELVQIAFDNRERDNKRLHDMHQIVDVELAEFEAKAAKWDALEKAVLSHASLEDMNADLELAQAVKNLCYAFGGTTAMHWETPEKIIDWHRAFQNGHRGI